MSTRIEEIFSRIREYRPDLSSDSSIAKQLNVDRSNVYQWKKRGVIPYNLLVDWCESEGVSLDWLISGDERGVPQEALDTRNETSKSPSDGIEDFFTQGLRNDFSFESLETDDDRESRKIGERLDAIVRGEFDESINERRHDSHSESKKNKDIPNYDYVSIPELSLYASAGHGAEILTEESEKSLVFKREWITAHKLQNKDLVMIHAKGDSMEPSIHCGDELLIDKSPMDCFVDGIYIIRIEKDLFVKRLRKRLTGAIDIISDNPAYPNETIDDSNSDLLHVIGKVVWIGRAV